MSLKDTIREKAEGYAIGYFVRSVESGRYGPDAQKLWFALKGKKTLISFGIMAIGGALAAFSDPSLATFGVGLAAVSSCGVRFGLICKGSDQSIKFPEEYRPEAQLALSIFTYITEVVMGISGLLLLSSREKAHTISLTLVLAGQALSTATGYISTLIGPTPTEAAEVAVTQAEKAVEVAKEVVVEKKEDVAVVKDIAADVAASPKAQKKKDK